MLKATAIRERQSPHSSCFRSARPPLQKQLTHPSYTIIYTTHTMYYNICRYYYIVVGTSRFLSKRRRRRIIWWFFIFIFNPITRLFIVFKYIIVSNFFSSNLFLEAILLLLYIASVYKYFFVI